MEPVLQEFQRLENEGLAGGGASSDISATLDAGRVQQSKIGGCNGGKHVGRISDRPQAVVGHIAARRGGPAAETNLGEISRETGQGGRFEPGTFKHGGIIVLEMGFLVFQVHLAVVAGVDPARGSGHSHCGADRRDRAVEIRGRGPIDSGFIQAGRGIPAAATRAAGGGTRGQGSTGAAYINAADMVGHNIQAGRDVAAHRGAQFRAHALRGAVAAVIVVAERPIARQAACNDRSLVAADGWVDGDTRQVGLPILNEICFEDQFHGRR